MAYKLLLTATLATMFGCGQTTTPPPAPRPVSVLALEETNPAEFNRVAGAVAPWKTDKLGFEVGGRVKFIIEPEQDVTAQIADADGKALSKGRLLAELDATRFELAVATAEAQIAVARKQREAAFIEQDRVVPAEIQAATARQKLAEIEVERNKKLLQRSAVAQRDVDRVVSILQQRNAELLQLSATKEAKAAEVASLDAKILELQEEKKSAERDRDDCKLYSSFNGQVADVHVVPGSVVSKGVPVVTVQMMDPIKVEFEVAAATARRLNHRDQVTVHVPLGDGRLTKRETFLYSIDPVADPNTRTFTVTLMTRNEKLRPSVPKELGDQPIARAGLIGKVLSNIPPAAGLYVNEAMIQKDETGFFLWKVLNRRIGALEGSTTPLLDVEKVRVTPGETRIPFFGIATLRSISLAETEEFNTDTDVVAGKITLPEGQAAWNGDKLLYDQERWLMRPGDLVNIDLSGRNIPQGIYVPLDAIMERSGLNFVFVVKESPDGDSARQVAVTVHESVGTLRRIEAAGDKPLTAGTKIVAAGAAFLADGESINVSRQVESRR